MAKNKINSSSSNTKQGKGVFNKKEVGSTINKSVAQNNSVIIRPNIGWLFYKKYYEGIFTSDWLEDNESKDKSFKKINEEIKNAPCNFSKEYKKIYDDFSRNSFILETTYPGLITGIGLIHETKSKGECKLGLQFDYSTGLPCILGSSIKGVLRSMFPFSLKKKKSIDDDFLEKYRKERNSYILDYCKTLKWKDDSTKTPSESCENLTDALDDDCIKTGCGFSMTVEDVKRLEEIIFEGCIGKEYIAPYKRDIFLDGLVIETGEKGLLGIDYITPHKDPLKNPIPIQFFKVLPKVKFKFSFRLDDSELGDGKIVTQGFKLALFKQILLDIGIGAKTNVGYGQFKDETLPSKSNNTK